MELSLKKKITESIEFIKRESSIKPELGIILGSGLSILADDVEGAVKIDYNTIPHFPVGSVKGHSNELIMGKFGKVSVAIMKGRFHYYEGFSQHQITFPVRVMAKLGIKNIIITNACGTINRDFMPGDLMIITDHINLMGDNPLIGYKDENGFGPRFVDMTNAYDKYLMEIAHDAAKETGIGIKSGIYAAVHGCSYETPAEIKMLSVIGADVVGMSTVPEVIVSNQMGINVLGLSCITNYAAGISSTRLDHKEVIKAAAGARDKFIILLKRIIELIV